MAKWRKCLVQPEASILEAIRLIDENAMQFAVVTDAQERLLGVVTDGDIRRAVLRGIDLQQPVALIMNTQPTVASENQERVTLLGQMKEKGLQQLPIVNKKGQIIGVETLKDLISVTVRTNPVVLMVGGLGTRLRPLTEECPKPLLQIGSKPILETILENFIEHGFKEFYFAVNYKKEMIQEYFGDGSQWGVAIRYLHEEERMGTAGALSLLSLTKEEPVIVMNGDLLTKVNFGHLLDFHMAHKAQATMCVREYQYQIPYGVIEMRQEQIVSLQEKPRVSAFVNAGIYVLEPTAIRLIPPHQYFDMTELFDILIQQQKVTAAFPIREYWLDIGRIEDFEKAKGEFLEIFG